MVLGDLAIVAVPLLVLSGAVYFGVTAEREHPHHGIARAGYASAVAGAWLLALLVLAVIVIAFVGTLYSLGHG